MNDLVTKLRIEARRDPEIQHTGHSILSDAADEIERLRAALKEIQAYSVGDPKPRHTWYYDRAEVALGVNQQDTTGEKVMTQSPAALRGAAREYRQSLGSDGYYLAGRLDDAAKTIETKDAEIERLRTAMPTPSSIRYALEHSGFIVSDGEIEMICRKLGIGAIQQSTQEPK